MEKKSIDKDGKRLDLWKLSTINCIHQTIDGKQIIHMKLNNQMQHSLPLNKSQSITHKMTSLNCLMQIFDIIQKS
jgi:hypothetical protein